MKYMFYYLGIINLISLCMYGADKIKARLNKWRIPEKVLFCVAFLGGSLGAFLGMQIFRHKTNHWSFKILIPLFIFIHICCIMILSNNGRLFK